MISTLTRERRKIERNLRGIRHMNRLPEALLVVDPRREHIAVAEARKLGIKVGRPARHRLRSRPDRPADPGQRRQHAVDRAGDQPAGRRDPRGQGRRARRSRQPARRAASRAAESEPGPPRRPVAARASAARSGTRDTEAKVRRRTRAGRVEPPADRATDPAARQQPAGAPAESGRRPTGQ